ncbi:MAG: Asp-tRNA(Asn)/Glu-tRNA(Gln) amidotransferase subunit GatA [Chloroflexi bacterium]|nr:Asp-tRNA(Asn)/Glu-tRNA(Gln) amidotransferase subunit GatA [Chloroflexota bacterium]
MAELHELDLRQAIEGLKQGDFSSRELTAAFLQRIEQLDGALQAFLHVAGEQALTQADQADKQRGENREAPPLLGVPLAVKDVLAVADMPATAGSRILEGFLPSYTATSVQRLLDAGMLVLGKTNTDEFAMGSSTENSAYFTTHNPWDLERVPGGSSGGSAAAVAGGLAPIALGTDTGGSVRQPAALSGVSGLRPTYGRNSRYGLIAFGSSLDCVGVLGRSVADIAILQNVMAGRDPKDASTSDRPVETAVLQKKADLKGLTIGVPNEYFIAGVQPAVEAAVRAAIQALADMGAAVREISLPHTEYALPVYYILAPAEASANLARFDGVRYGLRVKDADVIEMFKRTRGEGFGPEVKRRIMIGTYALSAGYYDTYYGQAQKVRTLIQRDFEAAFEQVDLIAGPTTPTTAFRIGEHSDDPLEMYLQDVFTLPSSLAGIPGISVPVGFDEGGLPIGMQLFAPHFAETKLLQAAHAYQMTTDWHLKRPSV